MQSRTSPFHFLSERDADVGRGSRISDFIREAQSGRDTLELESMQLPLALAPISCISSVPCIPASADTASPSPAVRGYDPASLANTLLAQASAAIEQLVRLMSVNDEREKQLHLYDDAQTSVARPSLTGATRSAIDGCLVSASALLDVTRALYNRLPDPTPQECVQESRELTELSKTAGRAAYRAALLIVDPEFQRAPRQAQRRPQKAQL